MKPGSHNVIILVIRELLLCAHKTVAQIHKFSSLYRYPYIVKRFSLRVMTVPHFYLSFPWDLSLILFKVLTDLKRYIRFELASMYINK